MSDSSQTKDFTSLMDEIGKRHRIVQDYLFGPQAITLDHPHLQAATTSYVQAGGKSLRPAVLMFACGAVGGDEMTAVPAAAAVELYHTFTLVHDDIIDRDNLRRGVPTVHVDFAQRAQEDFGYDATRAEHYGLAVAILAGDVQQGWAASLLPALVAEHGRSPEMALNLIFELFRKVQGVLINGETLDILLAETPIEQVTETNIIDMLRQKTGILYEFAGRAGAAIGLNEPNLRAPLVEAVATFTARCGVAFQIQDDILGVVGDSARTGKPVGNDIREGKRTIVLAGTIPHLTEAQRDFVFRVLGHRDASPDDIHEVAELMQSSGGIAYAQTMARQMVDEALNYLDVLPESAYKTLLRDWAYFILDRQL